MQPLLPVSQGALSSPASFSFTPNPQLIQNDQIQPSKSDTPATGAQAIIASSALTISHSGPLPFHNSSDFMMNASTTPNFAPVTSWMPTTPSFPIFTGSSGTSGTPGHPGLVPSVQMITASVAVDSLSLAVPRLSVHVSLNPAVQQQIYPTYTSLPSMASSPQGFWMQHPPMGGFPRRSFVDVRTDFGALLAEVITQEAAAQETGGGKTVLNSWSTAKRFLKPDPMYNKMVRKGREALWRRC